MTPVTILWIRVGGKHGVQELRRGAEPACIYSLAFSQAASPEWLAVSSDKGTVHIFSLAMAGSERTESAQQQPAARNGIAPSSTANPISALSFVSVSCLKTQSALQSCYDIQILTTTSHQGDRLLMLLTTENILTRGFTGNEYVLLSSFVCAIM